MASMIALGLVLIVILLGAVWGVSRRPAGDTVTARSADVGSEAFARWVEAGLLTPEQVEAVLEFERSRAPARPPARISPLTELLAYIGGVLLAVGAGLLVGQFWADLGTGGHLAVLAVAAVLTGVVGAVVGEAEPVTWRLRGFLWSLSAVAAGSVAGLVVFEVLDGRGEPVAFAAAATGGVVALGYWWLRDRPLQHVLTFVGLAVSLGVAIAWSGGNGLAVGATLWVLGCAWVALGWRQLVPPPRLGLLLGIVLTLVASAIVGSAVEWLAPMLGLATATAWMVAGVARADRLALVPATMGVFVFLPWTLGYFFGEALGAPAVTMASGALLLAVVLLLVRRGRGRGPQRTGPFRVAARP
jgi:hypothetical protein